METFFILAVVVFLPFVWFIVRMLRFTEETVGDDSLAFGLETSEKRTRTYQFSASDYFGTFIKVMYAGLFIMMLALPYILMNVVFYQQELTFRPLVAMSTLLFLAFAGYLAFYFYVDWKFWTITRDVSVTFDPYAPSVTVEGPAQIGVFTPDTVNRIEHHLLKIDNYKHPLFGYGCFYMHGRDGQLTRVNTAFFKNFSQQSFLERLFPSVPVTIVWHKFPYSSLIDQVEIGQAAEL